MSANHPVEKSKHLKTTHKTTHRLFHRLTRRIIQRPRGPNYAQQAVTAYNRFIRLHRRLMKLVPEVFDYGIEMHLRKQKEEDKKQMELFEPALERIYGPTRAQKTAPGILDGRCRNGAEKVQHPLDHLTPAKRRKVDALYEQRNMWLKVGRTARENMKKQPHFIPSFSLIARMMDTAFTMKRLMCGMETNLKIDPHEQLHQRNWLDDLNRIYGSNNLPETELSKAP